MIASGRSAAGGRVLAIGAHPDDAILGAGGYLFRLAKAGHEVLIMSVTSGELGGSPQARQAEDREAAHRIGANVVFGHQPDGEVTLSGALRCIEDVVRDFVPDLVLTHSNNDRHQDHVTVSRASHIACRQVPCLFAYESPSSLAFNPSTTIDCASSWEAKLHALDAYQSQNDARQLIEWVEAVGRFRAWPRHVGACCEGLTAFHADLTMLPSCAPAYVPRPAFVAAGIPLMDEAIGAH
jgi:LmbE family N-acetylglucosaminyl deacetylase